jgi:hypothetical protein
MLVSKSAVILFISLFISSSSIAQGTWNMSLITQWTGGVCHAVVLDGDTAYVGSGQSLEIIDFSDPILPTQIGKVTLGSANSNSFIRGVELIGDLAYLADQNYGLRIVEVSDPSNPIETGGIFLDHIYASDVVVRGNYAYLTSGFFAQGWGYLGHGIFIIDISNPSNPIQVGNFEISSACIGVAVENNFAYLAYPSGLYIIDVSDPSNPEEAEHIEIGYVTSVAIRDDIAFVGTRDDGLRLLDVSNPGFSTEIGSIETERPGWCVAIRDSLAYLSADGLRIINISNPENLEEIGYCETPGRGRGMDIAFNGDRAYIANEGGLHVINVAELENPSIIGFRGTGGPTPHCVERNGDKIFFMSPYWGLWSLDVSESSSPQAEGFFWHLGSNPLNFATSGIFAGIAGSAGFHLIDISDPSSFIETAFFDTHESTVAVAMADQYAYVQDALKLTVLDVLDPENPIEVGSIEGYGPDDMALRGDYAYIADAGLRIIDVSEPAALVELSWLWTGRLTEEVELEGDFAYLHDGANRIVDISDPNDPFEVFNDSSDQWMPRMHPSDNYVYLTPNDTELSVYYATDPTAMIEVASYNSENNISIIGVIGDEVYLNDGGSIRIIRNDHVVGVKEDLHNGPTEYTLNQNYPNPFNPTTTISYDLSEQSTVSLKVYDIRGQEVISLQEAERLPGSYEVQWNGLDQSGNPVRTGVYFCLLQAGVFSQTIKMVYLR